jgi:hypothetical protein
MRAPTEDGGFFIAYNFVVHPVYLFARDACVAPQKDDTLYVLLQ